MLSECVGLSVLGARWATPFEGPCKPMRMQWKIDSSTPREARAAAIGCRHTMHSLTEGWLRRAELQSAAAAGEQRSPLHTAAAALGASHGCICTLAHHLSCHGTN